MKIRYLGHASFQIQLGDTTLIVDPYITPNEKASNIDVDSLDTDILLVTHGHGDHVADVVSIAKRTGAKVYSSFEVVSWFQEQDVDGHPMNLGGQVKVDGLTIKYVNAVHSSVLPDGTYGANPGGFVVWNADQCLYLAGDTALTMDMQLIPKICPELTVAILPIGDNFTMGYRDAVIASDFIQCDKVIGCHYDTFGYIEIDHDAAKKAFSDAGKNLILMEIDETLEL